MNVVVELLFCIHLGATFYMVGLIWFVQLVHYPLFAYVGSAEFSSLRETPYKLDHMGSRAADAARGSHRRWSHLVRPIGTDDVDLVDQLGTVSRLMALDSRNPNALPQAAFAQFRRSDS